MSPKDNFRFDDEFTSGSTAPLSDKNLLLLEAAIPYRARVRAEAAEAAVEQLVGDLHAVSQDYTDLRARLRDLRDQWRREAVTMQAIVDKRPKVASHDEALVLALVYDQSASSLTALLVDPLTPQEK